MTAYADLLELAGIYYAAGAVVFLRVGAMMSVLPAFGERVVPMRVRLILALAFTAIVTPQITGSLPATFDVPLLLSLSMSEALIGLVLGIGLRLFILALQTAGSIAAQATSLSQLLGGASAEPLPAIGHVLTTAALALLMMSGLHVQVARLLILSYDALPPGQLPSASDITPWGISQVSHAFRLAFSLAAPFVILSALYNLTLGVINRAMPQLMVAFVGAPVITFGGVFLLFLLAPTILLVWHEAVQQYLSNPLGLRP